MSVEKSYYELLEVQKDASDSQLKKQYRKLVMKYHPDKLAEDKKEWGTQKIKELNEAYSVLSDPEKKRIYDQFGKEGLEGMGNMNGMGNGMDMDEFLNSMFGGGGFTGFPGFSGFGNGNSQKVRVKPVREFEEVTLEDLYNGKDVKKSIKRTSLCRDCEFTGFSDKKDHKCTSCNGSGSVVVNRRLGPNMISRMKQACESCQGSGSDKDAPACKACDGSKRVEEDYEVEFDIEKGMMDEEVITIKNSGHEIPPEYRSSTGPNAGQDRGVIQIILNEKEHDRFKRFNVNGRSKNDLLLELKIGLADALCGFKKSFDHLDGRKLYVSEMDVVTDGALKVVREEGMPSSKNSQKGDLFVKYSVEYPESIDDNKKGELYELLTGKKLESVEFPDEYKELNTFDFSGNNFSNYESSDDEFEEGGQRVQCAQQ